MKAAIREVLLERINTMLQNIPQHEGAQELLWQAWNSLLTETMGGDTPENKAALANLRIPALNQGTLLHFSAEHGHTWLIRELLKWGADVNFPDGTGQTPLHRASARGQVLAFELLLDNGAHRQIRDRNQRLPIDVATTEITVNDATVARAANAVADMQRLLQRQRPIPKTPAPPSRQLTDGGQPQKTSPRADTNDRPPEFRMSRADLEMFRAAGIDPTKRVKSWSRRYQRSQPDSDEPKR